MRLVDADALMCRFMNKPPDYYHSSYIVGEINTAPTVDAVPVVRCKDCKYWDKDEQFGGSDMCECKAHGGYFLANDYCSDGERREEDHA